MAKHKINVGCITIECNINKRKVYFKVLRFEPGRLHARDFTSPIEAVSASFTHIDDPFFKGTPESRKKIAAKLIKLAEDFSRWDTK